MCWECVVEGGGDKVVLDEEMKKICNLIWDWYHSSPHNESGGALHVPLDDFNVEDDFLTDNWYLNRPQKYSKDMFALGQSIVEALRSRTYSERLAIVHSAKPYKDIRPF